MTPSQRDEDLRREALHQARLFVCERGSSADEVVPLAEKFFSFLKGETKE